MKRKIGPVLQGDRGKKKSAQTRSLLALGSKIGVFLCYLSLFVLGQTSQASRLMHQQKVKFKEVDSLFSNPGQGWMSQQRSPWEKPRFPCSVVYIRFDWADIEPQEGQYNWKIVDDVIAAWKPYGASVSMRVMTANAHSAGYYSSPKWLYDAGCKGIEYLEGGSDPTSGGARLTRIEPDYTDPIYLSKHGAFLAALGKRYDGNPAIEFLDIGSYGIWGEWHSQHPAPLAVRKQIVDMYFGAFRHTPLVFMTDDVEVLTYALTKGVGLRRDGIASPWHEQNWIGSPRYAGATGMEGAWKKAPVVFEWFGDYDYIKSQNWSFDAAVKFMLANHVTMINDNIGKFPEEARPQLEALARRAGYRFVLREISHDTSVKRGSTLKVAMKWDNVGVGKLYRRFDLQLSLVDSLGKTVANTQYGDARDWLPGLHDVVTQIPVPARLKFGTYTISVALTDPAHQHPPLHLAMQAAEKEGWYQVSKVKITDR